MNALGSYIQKNRLFFASLAAGFAITTLLFSFDFFWLESRLYDFRMRAKNVVPKRDTHVVIVNIDDETTDRLREPFPLSLKSNFLLLQSLSALKPKAIAFLMNFNDSPSAEGSVRFPPVHDDFVKFANNLAQQGMSVFLSSEIDVTGEVLPPFPLNKIPHGVSLIHKDGTTFAEDKITRRAVFSIDDELTLNAKLGQLFSPTRDPKTTKGLTNVPEIDSRYFLINYIGDTREKYHPFAEVSAIDVLEGKITAEAFENKIVLVGTKSYKDASDFVFTPYSRHLFENSKLIVHANTIETLIRNNAILQAPQFLNFLVTFIFTSLITLLVLITTPAKSLMVMLLSQALVLFTSVTAFLVFDWWIELSHCLLGIFSAYYLFVPYRLIVEYKQRWQFQKRNDVLRQVEELKSNFMSLITHDLKTPVARIQGMAEILERTGADKKITSEILSSTHELNLFITSILELAKIESDRVELKKSSKDINKIIEDVTDKFQFEAQKRNIAIQLDLEPLFPIWLDVALISKVISNLIDNAIKYSPEKSTVTVESRETDGYIRVAIKDQGCGIEDSDREQLFTKFFRAKNDITMKTKGTGLGLFLSRYFIDLHSGKIDVQSKPGEGTVFTLYLPNGDKDSSETKKQKIFEGARNAESFSS